MIYRLFSVMSSQPLYWVGGLFVMSFWIRKPLTQRVIRLFAMAMLLFFSVQPPYQWAERAWTREYDRPLPTGATYTYGIVLGGFAQHDWEHDRPEFDLSADRWIESVRLYHQGVIRKIVIASDGSVVTNGAGKPDAMIRLLATLQVMPEDIILETKAETTYENAVFTRALIDHEAGGRVLLITSAVHMRRSVAVFKEAGLSVDTYCTDYEVAPVRLEKKIEAWIPAVSTLYKWEMLLHEIVGVAVYRLRGFL